MDLRNTKIVRTLKGQDGLQEIEFSANAHAVLREVVHEMISFIFVEYDIDTDYDSFEITKDGHFLVRFE